MHCYCDEAQEIEEEGAVLQVRSTEAGIGRALKERDNSKHSSGIGQA